MEAETSLDKQNLCLITRFLEFLLSLLLLLLQNWNFLRHLRPLNELMYTSYVSLMDLSQKAEGKYYLLLHAIISHLSHVNKLYTVTLND